MIKKIGFCCKYVKQTPSGIISVPEVNTKSTTVSWLKRQTKAVAEQKLYELMVHNINSISNLIEKVSKFDNQLRMVRLSSDILPVYTERNFSYFWQQKDVRDYAEREFYKAGEIARMAGVRLSFHPGQFCVLASDSDDIVNRSVEEFEYHADMARWLGYGKAWHDHEFKINVHVSGRQGPAGIKKILPRLSVEARNLITIENEENKHGLNEVLDLEKDCALVLDIHHHFINTGEYIQPNDDRVKRVIDSWRGVRPVLHYSISREDLLVTHASSVLPDMNALLALGYKKQKLRAHSDFYWNKAANAWALSFWDNFDICCESKAKNLASFALFEESKTF
jgi:UV DNA damage endonuclease